MEPVVSHLVQNTSFLLSIIFNTYEQTSLHNLEVCREIHCPQLFRFVSVHQPQNNIHNCVFWSTSENLFGTLNNFCRVTLLQHCNFSFLNAHNLDFSLTRTILF